MLKVRLDSRAGKAQAIVVPIRTGQAIPAADRDAATAAGFTGTAATDCAVIGGAQRRLLVGLGDAPNPVSARRAGALAAARLLDCRRIALDTRGLSPELAAALAAGAVARAWRHDRLRTRPDADAPRLEALDLLTDDPDALASVWARTEAVERGVAFARDLAAEPANLLTPKTFAARLRELERYGLHCEVMKPAALRSAGLAALLAVGGGSEHTPRLVVLRWKGTIQAPPVAFIGKGLTFDTGGISIKPAHKMWEMKGDMAGAAACAGAMLALALRRSPAPAVAVLPLAENATGAASYRPGDVLRAVNGTTIEVVDTDAEGRLVLADALAWTAATLRPQAMIDLATLTGSIVVALGHDRAGLFDNDAELAAQVAAAAAAADEPVWPMPITASHREDLNSDIADLRHCLTGKLLPDASHAAAFLREFVGEIPWAHLDIAGVADVEEADDAHAAGPTGFGVRLLDRLVAQRFEDADRR